MATFLNIVDPDKPARLIREHYVCILLLTETNMKEEMDESTLEAQGRKG